MTPKQEARLYSRAIKSRWPVPDDTKTVVIETLTSIAESEECKESARVAACNAILAAEGQNQKDEHKVLDKLAEQRIAELDQIADELGLETSVVEGIAKKSEPDY